MNKKELIESVSKERNLTKKDAEFKKRKNK